MTTLPYAKNHLLPIGWQKLEKKSTLNLSLFRWL